MRPDIPTSRVNVFGILRWWIPPILWVGVIFALSSTPVNGFPRVDIPHLDKVVHFLLFFLFGVFIARAHRASVPGTPRVKVAVMSVLLAGTYAFFDECHQQFIPGRMVEAGDLVADLMGLGVGIACYLVCANRKG